MGRIVRALGAGVSVVLVATIATVVPTGASAVEAEPAPTPRGVQVIQARLDGAHHGTSQATVDIPGNGVAKIVSPTVPSDVTKAKVTVSTPLSDEPAFENLALTLMAQPTKSRRIVSCATYAVRGLAVLEFLAAMEDDLATYEALESTLFNARLEYCLRVAFLVSSYLENPDSFRAATSPCGTAAPIGIKEIVTKDAEGYHVTKDGPATAKKKNSPVRLTCRVLSPTKVTMTIKPRKKGSTLRKALRGKKVPIALGNASSESAKTTVKFQW